MAPNRHDAKQKESQEDYSSCEHCATNYSSDNKPWHLKRCKGMKKIARPIELSETISELLERCAELLGWDIGKLDELPRVNRSREAVGAFQVVVSMA